jgi:hypothetical protein
MDDTRARGVTRVAVVAVATLVVIYAANLTQLVLTNRRAEAVEAGLRQSVERELMAIEAVEAQTIHAQSDAAAEEFARNEKDWVRPGDNPVIVIPLEEPPAEPAAAAESPDEPSAWQRLLRWLKGE